MKKSNIPTSARGHERLYRCWKNMRARCGNPNAANFKNYGGRGITVCSEWQSWAAFKDWALSNGYAPDLTIERVDGDKGYAPDNCTWATTAEQNRNRRGLKRAPDGTLYSEIAERNGVAAEVYRNRLWLGWCPAHAASIPNLGRGLHVKPCGEEAGCSEVVAQVAGKVVFL